MLKPKFFALCALGALLLAPLFAGRAFPDARFPAGSRVVDAYRIGGSATAATVHEFYTSRGDFCVWVSGAIACNWVRPVAAPPN